MASCTPRAELAEPYLLGKIRGSCKQPGCDEPDLEAHAKCPQDFYRLEGSGHSRFARVSAISIRQHDRRRAVQRMARSNSDRRVANDRLAQHFRDDKTGNAWSVCARRF